MNKNNEIRNSYFEAFARGLKGLPFRPINTLQGIDQIASFCNRNVFVVMDWIHNQDFPAHKGPGAVWIAEKKEVKVWMRKHGFPRDIEPEILTKAQVIGRRRAERRDRPTFKRNRFSYLKENPRRYF